MKFNFYPISLFTKLFTQQHRIHIRELLESKLINFKKDSTLFIKTNVKFFTAMFLCISKFAAANDTSTYECYVNEITSSFIKEIEKEFGISCCATGGSMPHDVVEIQVDFNCYKQVTLEEARELVIKVTEILRERINEHEKIRPYLRDYPCKSQTAHVMISFHKMNGDTQTEGVALVFPARNKLFFRKYDSLTKKLCALSEEPYEKALKIVQNRESPGEKNLTFFLGQPENDQANDEKQEKPEFFLDEVIFSLKEAFS